MNIVGRHAGLTGKAEFRGYIATNGTIHVECDKHPPFWMDIELDGDDLRELLRNLPEPSEDDDDVH